MPMAKVPFQQSHPYRQLSPNRSLFFVLPFPHHNRRHLMAQANDQDRLICRWENSHSCLPGFARHQDCPLCAFACKAHPDSHRPAHHRALTSYLRKRCSSSEEAAGLVSNLINLLKDLSTVKE